MDEFENNLREALRESQPFPDVTRKVMSRVAPARKARPRFINGSWSLVAAAAALVLIVVSIALMQRARAAYVTVERSDGSRYRAALDRQVYSGDGSLFVSLPDGSRIEMRSQSGLVLQTAADGLRIALNNGSIIVTAARQGNGHLYVRTRDVTVSVVGTVFLVNAEEAGSRVAVIQGEVHVQEGATSKKLLPGQQVASAQGMPALTLPEEIAWSRHAAEHIALLKHILTANVERPNLAASEGASAEAASPEVETAQTRPAFEVASIKPSYATTSVMGGCQGPDGKYLVNSISPEPPMGRCVFYNGTLKHLVSFAYSPWPVPLPLTTPISGGPDWLMNDRYSVEAKSPDPSARVPELQEMLRNLLADRFKLIVHDEAQNVSGYALGAGKIGPLLRESSADAAERISGIPAKIPASSVGAPIDRTITITAQHCTMAKLAGLLSRLGPGPVEDKTNLSGAYDFKLTWNEAAGPSLFTALKELGLQLQAQKVRVRTIVIDHAEKPLPN